VRKKGIIYGLLGLFLLGACGGAMFWLLGTPAGARWIGEFLARQAAIRVEVRKLEGSIWGGLVCEDLKLSRPPIAVQIKDLRLRWQPGSLFAGRATFEELLIQGVTVQDDRPETKEAPDLSWPGVTAVMALVEASFSSLEVKQIVYTRRQQPPVEISRLTGSVLWQNGRLTAKNIILAMPGALITGELTAGFRKPALHLDLAVDLQPARAGMKKIFLKTRLEPAAHPEQVAGEVTIVGVSSADRRAALSGEIGLTRSSMNLRKLSLKQPEQKGTITGEGELTFPQGSPFLRLQTKLAHLDFIREVRLKTDLGGVLTFAGTPEMFRGSFSLANRGKGWLSASLTGAYTGGGAGVKVDSLAGLWMGGKIGGGLAIAWKERVTVRGNLQGKDLNPALLSPEWRGVINLTAEGDLQWSAQTPLEGNIAGRLLASRLRGQALTGEVKARFREGELVLTGLDLHGKGFDIHASGALKERINYRADIGDLSGLIPDTRGRLQAQGWVNFQKGVTGLAARGRGSALAAAGVKADNLTFDVLLGAGKDRPVKSNFGVKGLKYGSWKLTSAALTLQGPLSRHTITAELRADRSEVNATLTGSYLPAGWQGRIMKLSGSDSSGPWRLQSPADLRLMKGGFSLSPLTLRGSASESLELEGEMQWQPRQGNISADWSRINLARINAWVTDFAVLGGSSGSMEALWREGELRLLAANLNAAGTVTSGKHRFNIREATGKLAWDKQGLLASTRLVLAEKGRIEGSISSPANVLRLAVPEAGEFQAGWEDIDLSLFQVWVPPRFYAKGRISGQVRGKLLAGGRTDVTGTATLQDGFLGWQQEKGQFTAELRKAVVSAAWQGETVSGDVDLTLKEYGQARAVFKLPIPARFPVAADEAGKLAVSVKGRLQEMGLITSLFPGLVPEKGGEMGIACTVGGTWNKPVVGASAELTHPGAYLPPAGIRLQQISLKARLEGEQVHIDSFRATSGPGNMELKAVINLEHWTPATYSGTVKGNRFQTVYLPELRMLTNPDLSFNGTPQKLSVRGELMIPELTALGGQGPAVVTSSADVVIVDAPQPQEKPFPLALDLRIRVTMGEKVVVKAEGVEVQLGDSVDLTFESLGNIRGKGALKVIKGKYNAYGVVLDRVTGRLVFDGPAVSPKLDVLALRQVDDTTIGVLITGPLDAPVIKLYSRPAMPDPDIMAYLVLGHPLGGDTQQLTLVTKVAGLLLPKGEATSLQAQLKRRLGIDTLGVEVSKAPVTSAGPAGAKEPGPGAMARSVVTIGKYLTPKLYISYGRSLFSEANIVRLRYRFNKNWELETQSGTVSGADIFYKLEFR